MNYRIKLFAGLVCPRRSLDYKKLEKYFIANGCEIVDNPDKATHIIIITCGFIDRNINESLELIATLQKYGKKMIVGGCLKDIAENVLVENFDGPIFTTKEMSLIETFFPEFRIKLDQVPDANHLHDYHEIDSVIGNRKKIVEKYFFNQYHLDYSDKSFTIRIGDGCNCRCTYCSHINAIGPYRSKSIETCMTEFELGYHQGYRIFRITSMDTGSYGVDIKMTLPVLMYQFLETHSDVEFILEDINPMWLLKYGEDILNIVARKKIKVIQCPVQSGSNRILKKMHRLSCTEKLKDFFVALKKSCPDLLLSTEILLGFPAETDRDFDDTMSLLKEAGIDFTYIYPYYENDFIESRKFFPKNSNETIQKRLMYAIDFCKKNRISHSVMLTDTGVEMP